jgi:hemolysin activation/secretion protein
METVRGFNEREFAGDDGHHVTLELLSPPGWYDLQGLAFYDWGEASVHTPVPPQPSSIAIASAGVGLRWGWGDRVSLALDFAIAVKSAPSASGVTITTVGSQKLLGTLLVRF